MPKKIIHILLGSTILLFLFSLWQRIPDVDDAWLGEHAYWLAKLGYVKSELMRGITQQEIRVLLHHKLFIALGALSIKIFGFHLYVLKTITLLFLLVFFRLFYWFTVQNQRFFSNTQFAIATLLLLTHPLIFKHGFIYRPEIMLMTLGFGAYILLHQTLQTAKNQTAILAGVVSGLCLLTHLNGMAFIGTGFLLLAWSRQFKVAFWFSIGAILTTSLYFYDFTTNYNFEFWFGQLSNNPYHKTPFGVQLFLNVLDEQMRFFHSIKEIPFTMMLLGVLLMSYTALKKSQLMLLRYTLWLILIIGAISLYKTTKYMIAYLPFLVIIVVQGGQIMLNNLEKAKRKAWIKGYMSIAIVSFLGVGFYFNLELAIKKYDSRANRKIATTYLKGEPSELKIIAPMTFVFHELGRFQRIQSDLSFTEMQKFDKSIKGTGFLKKAKKEGVDYILLSTDHQKQLDLQNFDKKNQSTDYQFIERKKQWLLLQKIPDLKDSTQYLTK